MPGGRWTRDVQSLHVSSHSAVFRCGEDERAAAANQRWQQDILFLFVQTLDAEVDVRSVEAGDEQLWPIHL